MQTYFSSLVLALVAGKTFASESSAETPAPSPSSTPSGDESDSSDVLDQCTRSYDDKNYCLCPPPVVYENYQDVSVCGDATYEIPVTEKACSGPISSDPAGTACPKQGDRTTIACRSEILSYLTGIETGADNGECVAPEDAVCTKLSTGAWGCVFPGNCNTVNTCTNAPTCDIASDEEQYETNDDGTCKVMENGYPAPSENNTALANTAEYTKLSADEGSSSAAGHLAISGAVLMSVVLAYIA